MLLDGRVAIVAGVGPGMGRDIALAFAREGADVVLAARTAERLEDVAREVEGEGRRALCQPTDVTDDVDCERLAAAAHEAFGRLDVAVYNAFVQPPFETIEEAPLETWQRTFDVNVFGGVRMAKAVLPYMKARRGGSIVFVNSMSARRVRPRFGIYAAAKSALLSTARTLAKELGEAGIRVNSVVPGYIWGPSLQWYFGEVATQRGCTPQDVYDEVAAETCLGQIPTSAEVADAVLFFASDLSRVVTGQALDVNAGHWFH